MPGLRSASSGTRLFLAYTACSLVPVLALGAVLVRGNAQDALERGLAQGRAQAAVVEEMAIAPALQGGDLTVGLTDAERRRLQTATDLAIFRGTISRLRIRDFAGGVVFSDYGPLVRADVPEAIDVPVRADDPAFLAATRGGTEVALVDGPDDGSAIRVLQPILADASGRSVGVLELVLPYDAVAAEAQAAAVRTLWRLCAGLAVLYLVLGGISWSTTRRLRRQAAQAEHDALHDPLTGLPNRALFRRRLERGVAQGRHGAVVVVDLDRFKEVNDSLGHQAGDELLRAVAGRLTRAVRDGDLVARLGGDEFGLALPDLTDGVAARELVQRVSDALSRELVVAGVPLTVEASFGIALHPEDGDDVETLMNRADAAMYQGKRGADGVVVFDAARSEEPTNDLTIQHDIRRAMERDELRLVYQPQLELATGRVRSVEALLRWEHPLRGLIPPGEFLPAVERSAAIGALTEWVLRRALADCARWTALGHAWHVAVNVSARNLEQVGFADTVALLAADAGIAAGQLQLEVTETALPADLAAASRALEALREHGFGIALDDFGVGYASLSHLRDLPLTEVKIDSAYGPDGRTIVGFEPDLGAALGELLGLEVEFRAASFGGMVEDVAEHRYDAVMSAMTHTAERQEQVDFVTYFEAGTSIVVQRGNPFGIADLRGLCGRTVAVEAGTIQVDLLERSSAAHCPNTPIVVEPFPTNDDALVELRTGRAAAVLNDYPPAVYVTTAERTRASYQLVSDVQYEPGRYGIAVAPNRPQLRDALAAALAELIDGGRYADVLADWDVTSGAVDAVTVNGTPVVP